MRSQTDDSAKDDLTSANILLRQSLRGPFPDSIQVADNPGVTCQSVRTRKRSQHVYCPSLGRNLLTIVSGRLSTSRHLAGYDFRIACETTRVRDLLLPVVS